MTNHFLYESLIPLLIICTLALLSSELIGRSKHIGRGYSFFMMLGIIPGIIGLLFSPSANKQPTKEKKSYYYLGVFLLIGAIFGFFENINNLTFIVLFVTISFFASTIYCFELAKGNIINKEPKYYFEKKKIYSSSQDNIQKSKNTSDNLIKNLTDLRNKGLLSEIEFYEKIAKIKTEQAQDKLKNSIEYKQLKNLLDSGMLTKEEFDNKINLLHFNDSEIKNEGIKTNGGVSQKTAVYSKSTNNKNNKMFLLVSLMIIITIIIYVYQKNTSHYNNDNFEENQKVIESNPTVLEVLKPWKKMDEEIQKSIDSTARIGLENIEKSEKLREEIEQLCKGKVQSVKRFNYYVFKKENEDTKNMEKLECFLMVGDGFCKINVYGEDRSFYRAILESVETTNDSKITHYSILTRFGIEGKLTLFESEKDSLKIEYNDKTSEIFTK